jgi:hypothetical protein
MMRFLLVSVLVWHMIACSAQVSVKDSVVRIPMLSVSYAYQIPGTTQIWEAASFTKTGET